MTERMLNITQLPFSSAEYLQLLRYEAGQYYRAHHDTSHHYTSFAQGHRIYTLFFYLSDVEEGGETHFPRLPDAIGSEGGAVARRIGDTPKNASLVSKGGQR